MILVVGLGNPGREYDTTPHNAGFAAVEALRELFHAEPFRIEKKFFARVTTGRFGREHVVLAQPTTMMNLSGNAVRALLAWRDIPLDHVWVLHDEVDLPLGALRHSFASRAAGHRGVQSIIDALGSNAFHRMRIGVGRSTKLSTSDYVLRPQSAADRAALASVIDTLATKDFERLLSEHS